jgi:hypothetical protein
MKFEKRILHVNDYDNETTCFYGLNPKKPFNNNKSIIFLQLKATPGMCLIFNQNILHDGETVNNGCKYTMRTDMIYKAHQLDNELSEEDKEGIKIYGEDINAEKEGKFIEAVKLYEKATDLCHDAYLMYY